ncbi:MAG: nuclease [Nocardioides sp.]|nr:nuclease [Nocardioides sp.]
MAIAAPKHQTAVEGTRPPRRPGPERMGRAFMEYIERYPTTKLPQAGGVNATAVVLIPLETLIGGLKAAHLDTGEPISAGQARRLACEAGIIPIVLGGKSQVLEVGRKSRFHNQTQRLAIGVRDKTCTAEEFDWPPGPVPRPSQHPLAPGRRHHGPGRAAPLRETPREPRSPPCLPFLSRLSVRRWSSSEGPLGRERVETPARTQGSNHPVVPPCLAFRGSRRRSLTLTARPPVPSHRPAGWCPRWESNPD